MTPDGISTNDWEKVVELTAAIADAADDDELWAERKKQMLELLDELEKKYGVLPSILMTRADHIEDNALRLRLLERAFEMASQRGIRQSMRLVAYSLASLFIDELDDAKAGKHWLDVLASDPDWEPDPEERSLMKKLEELKSQG